MKRTGRGFIMKVCFFWLSYPLMRIFALFLLVTLAQVCAVKLKHENGDLVTRDKENSADSSNTSKLSKLENYKQFFDKSFKSKFSKHKDVAKSKDSLIEPDVSEVLLKFPAYSSQQPVCPLNVHAAYEEKVVEQVLHSVRTLHESYDTTEWKTVTKTLPLPVTMTQRSVITITTDPIYVTETKVVPIEKAVTKAKLVSVEKVLTHTHVDVKTYTVTNVVTKTEVEPLRVTLTEITTQWVTSTVPVISTLTEWVSRVKVITQPVNITTSLWVEAPQLSLMTSTEVHPHYITTTEFVTKVKYHSL